MARRGYSGTPTYSSRRPRTKIYDSNYSMGEAAYRSALDNLDRKQFGRVLREEPPAHQEERISPPRRPRPLSMSEIEANWDGPGPAPRLEEASPSIDELLERIKAARSRSTHNDQSFDSAFTIRREDVKKRLTEKILDTVGINGEHEERRPLRHHALNMEEPKWPSLVEQGESAAEQAARARARQTRARIADINAEMAEMEQRGVARERRAAAIRQLLASSNESADSVSIASKKITVTEKRTTSAY